MDTQENNCRYKIGEFIVAPINNSIQSSDGASCSLSDLTFSLLMKLIKEAPNVVSQKDLIQKNTGSPFGMFAIYTFSEGKK